MLSRAGGFKLYGKQGVKFLPTSNLLYPNQKIRLRPIRTRINLYVISDNPNISFGNVDCSLQTRLFAFKDAYHKKKMYMLAYTPVELIFLETPAKIVIIPATQNLFIQKNVFNNAPVRRIAIGMNTNSAFTGSFY